MTCASWRFMGTIRLYRYSNKLLGSSISLVRKAFDYIDFKTGESSAYDSVPELPMDLWTHGPWPHGRSCIRFAARALPGPLGPWGAPDANRMHLGPHSFDESRCTQTQGKSIILLILLLCVFSSLFDFWVLSSTGMPGAPPRDPFPEALP